MDAKRMTKKFFSGGLTALMLLFGVWVAVAAQVTGAIFTTTRDGGFVNANVYDNEFDPFLNGGPQPNAPCTAAGLPDGNYYFQVTDPSGAVLLSSDDVTKREVNVANGVIKVYLGGTHSTSPGQCEDLTVQLYPFSSTPNPGGEYKVWMTPVSSYDTSGNGSFGFIPGYSKTDNFKVMASDCGEEGCPE